MTSVRCLSGALRKNKRSEVRNQKWVKSVSPVDRGTFFLCVWRAWGKTERTFSRKIFLISDFLFLIFLDKSDGFVYTNGRRVCLSVACHVAERYWHEESPGPAGQDNG